MLAPDVVHSCPDLYRRDCASPLHASTSIWLWASGKVHGKQRKTETVRLSETKKTNSTRSASSSRKNEWEDTKRFKRLSWLKYISKIFQSIAMSCYVLGPMVIDEISNDSFLRYSDTHSLRHKSMLERFTHMFAHPGYSTQALDFQAQTWHLCNLFPGNLQVSSIDEWWSNMEQQPIEIQWNSRTECNCTAVGWFVRKTLQQESSVMNSGWHMAHSSQGLGEPALKLPLAWSRSDTAFAETQKHDETNETCAHRNSFDENSKPRVHFGARPAQPLCSKARGRTEANDRKQQVSTETSANIICILPVLCQVFVSDLISINIWIILDHKLEHVSTLSCFRTEPFSNGFDGFNSITRGLRFM